jgi:hypothetical protein
MTDKTPRGTEAAPERERAPAPQPDQGPRDERRRDPDLNDPNVDAPDRGEDPNIDQPGQPPGRPDQEIDLPGPDRVPTPTRQD